MKKIYFAIYSLIFVFTICQTSIPVRAAEVPNISTPYYSVMDACSGEILFNHNADELIYPASSVKLVTAMVIIDAVPLDQTITVTSDMLKHISPDAAQIGLHASSTYSVYELLQMLLLSSAADAAQVLAESCFGSSDQCVVKMNEKVLSIGLTQTCFDNVIGLDTGNGFKHTYTTANEFIQLCRYAMSYDIIRQIVATHSYTIPARANTPSIQRNNTNRFYSSQPYNSQLYTIIGSKTGTTNNAGNVLITTASDGIHEVICVSFKNGTRNQAYTETRKLLDYTYNMAHAGNLQLASRDYQEWYLPAIPLPVVH